MESSQYDEHLMQSRSASQTKSSKKKLRFFSKSKSKRSEYEKSNQCFCDECMRTAVNQNSYAIGSQQPVNPYYYGIESQAMSGRQLSASAQPYHRPIDNPEEHTYMEIEERMPTQPYVERIYPPPKEFPCECTNCHKKRGHELTTELLPLDTQIPLQMMGDSAVLCNIL